MKGDTRVIGALTQCPLFYGRPIHALVPTCTLRHYSDGQPIYRADDAASHLVVLRTGHAEVVDGAGRVVGRYRAPAAFGEAGLFARHRHRHVTARAAGEVDAVLVPRDALLHAAADDVVITERLLTALADTADPAPPATDDPAAQVLNRLRALAAMAGIPETGGIRIAAKLTHGDLAALLGIPRRDLSAQLAALVAAGELGERGGYWVLPDIG